VSEGTSTMNEEHVALVALLRTRPNRLTWRKLTNEALECGSASAVWSYYNPDQLIPSPEATAAPEDAAKDLVQLENSGLQFISVLDKEFPWALAAQSRHQRSSQMRSRQRVLG
jgi:DNA processing protein